MKHLAILLFLSCYLLATSCSEDETPASDELIGTVWSQVAEGRTDTIYFAADRKCMVEWKYEGLDAVKQEYRYSIDGKVVSINTGSNTATGHIEDDVLYIQLFDRDLSLHRIR